MATAVPGASGGIRGRPADWGRPAASSWEVSGARTLPAARGEGRRGADSRAVARGPRWRRKAVIVPCASPSPPGAGTRAAESPAPWPGEGPYPGPRAQPDRHGPGRGEPARDAAQGRAVRRAEPTGVFPGPAGVTLEMRASAAATVTGRCPCPAFPPPWYKREFGGFGWKSRMEDGGGVHLLGRGARGLRGDAKAPRRSGWGPLTSWGPPTRAEGRVSSRRRTKGRGALRGRALGGDRAAFEHFEKTSVRDGLQDSRHQNASQLRVPSEPSTPKEIKGWVAGREDTGGRTNVANPSDQLRQWADSIYTCGPSL